MIYTVFLLLSFWVTMALVIGLGVAPLMRERVAFDGDADGLTCSAGAVQDAWLISAAGRRKLAARLCRL